MSPAPIDLLFPDPRALARLGEQLDLEAGRERTVDRVLLDSFDGRLRAEGLRAERPAGRSRGTALTLHEPGVAARRAEVERAPRYLVEELPAGPLRERLAGVLEERALLPAVRVRSVVQSLAVLNGDAKTVVRLHLERAEAIVGGERVPLAPRLSVHPVLGYDDDHERVVHELRDVLGLQPAEQPLFDEAVLAAGGRPEGISTKPKVKLAPGTRTDEAAGRVLKRLLKIAKVNLPGTLEDLDTEFLHDLRVSIRRARSVLRELKHVHDPAERQRLRDELRWAQALTGPVRDLDVQLLEWNDLVALLPPERAPELEPLRALLARRRARELTKLRRGLRSKRFTAALEAWRALATGPGPDEAADAARPIEAVAGHRIRRVYRRMVSDGSRIDDDTPGRGAARAAQARQGAALPARAVRQPVPGGRGQAAGVDAQGPPSGARALPGPRRPDRAAAGGARGAGGRARGPERADGRRRGARRARRRPARGPRRVRRDVRGLRRQTTAQARPRLVHAAVKVVATYSIKGGVGKTSAAVNVGALAARDGLRTVIWDLDPQGAASFLFRVEPKVKGGSKQLIRGRREPLDVMKGTDIEGLDLLPADFSYRHLDIQLDKRKKPLEGLARVLAQLEDRYDLAVIDCAPSISLVSESVFTAADLLLVPLIPSTLSARTYDQLRDFLAAGPQPAPAVLAFFSMVDRRKNLHKELMETLPGVAETAIPSASAVERMGVRRSPLVTTNPRNPVALAYAALWEELRAALKL